ncbi:hypothetical protein AJ79_05335 [Helicocarpus griseus UAMH5409]|uniref:Oxidoreductase acuF-like C2H2 type zinc-finger domain-containing protein n=1 Tax=Helicocarpus griseus UAMH5409 TaxID=1447875 RepID=A0A2B7XG90_9EURO|nr:hypothetical protein AJ79_05335 [Helicocarpus griseus UAMH5409]
MHFKTDDPIGPGGIKVTSARIQEILVLLPAHCTYFKTTADKLQRLLAASVKECDQLFGEVLALFPDPKCAKRSDLARDEIVEELDRFKRWVAEEEALSFDRRFRGSACVLELLQKFLGCLHESLQTIFEIVSGAKPNRKSKPFFDEDEPADDSYLPDPAPAQQQGDERPRNTETLWATWRSLLTTPFDINHVGAMFPNLDTNEAQWLKERLGRAISHRRQYLQYTRSRRHFIRRIRDNSQLKKSKAIDVFKATFKGTFGRSRKARKSILPKDYQGSEPPTPATPWTPGGALPTPQLERQMQNLDLDDDLSQTSSLSPGDGDAESRLQLPKLCSVSKGARSFECPFCYRIQSFTSEAAWRKHALSDLYPYVCTFPPAVCGKKLFSHVDDWFEHGMSVRRVKYLCPWCMKDEYKSAEQFEEHLLQHIPDPEPHELELFSSTCRRCVNKDLASECPFCTDWETKLRMVNYDTSDSEIVVTHSQFKRHIGSHMRQLIVLFFSAGRVKKKALVPETIGRRVRPLTKKPATTGLRV